jgi:hypothetical protein
VKQAWDGDMAARWDRLPYHAQRRVLQGTAATLLGLVFSDAAPADEQACAALCWKAIAVGDTCLFQVRADRLHRAFPLAQAGQFNNTPQLLYSKRSRNEQLVPAHAEGDWLADDVMLLATDALACWILHETEAERQPWRILCALTEQAEFEVLIDRLRRSNQLENDDTTLIVITSAPAVPPAGCEPAPPAAARSGEPRGVLSWLVALLVALRRMLRRMFGRARTP